MSEKLEKWKVEDSYGHVFVFVGVDVEPVIGATGWMFPFYAKGRKVWKYSDTPKADWHRSKQRLPVQKSERTQYERDGRVFI